MKLLYIVLDGAPDGFRSDTALALADKPGIDELARHGVCGLVHVVGEGVAPESDVAVLSLLGYEPDKYYTGRGPLEALGAGLDMPPGSVAVRANFATVDPETLRIIDRRVGRSLTSMEARRLAEAIDGMSLMEGEATARFRATIGHRGVLLLTHKRVRLSGEITNTDPAYERRGRISIALEEFEPRIMEAKPLSSDPAAEVTARLVNEFTHKAIEVLDRHEVNIDRRRRGLLPANAVLLRDAGDQPPPAEPFKSRFGLDMASIVEMVVERGIARALGITDIPVEVEGRGRREVLEEEASKVLKALESHDGVYVHLKGPDEPGHDGDLEGKIKAIEDIDKYFIQRLLAGVDPSEVLTIV
ncbi:MAG: 2,3-bisphosphoglycerate-independent phosphoglycerate mutase, partial [Desulfurococcales archaeon]|nr:2,3-bisphosphoglycerate-independent phosphoglycerate mutase [Desulfurococcales archaeon]